MVKGFIQDNSDLLSFTQLFLRFFYAIEKDTTLKYLHVCLLMKPKLSVVDPYNIITVLGGFLYIYLFL